MKRRFLERAFRLPKFINLEEFDFLLKPIRTELAREVKMEWN
jgi:hypothetical protein